MMRIAVALIVVLLSACAPEIVLAPGAANIVVTRTPADVERCSALGPVRENLGRAMGGAVTLSEDIARVRQLKNQAIALHADTLLITTFLESEYAGIAYRCKTPSPGA